MLLEFHNIHFNCVKSLVLLLIKDFQTSYYTSSTSLDSGLQREKGQVQFADGLIFFLRETF